MSHTIIVADSKVFCFGCGVDGQLGLGDSENKNKPQLLMTEGVKQIACGSAHSLLLKKNNDLLVFGHNRYGQLGLGHNTSQNKPQLLMSASDNEIIQQIICGEYHSMILKETKQFRTNDSCNKISELLVFGQNRYGQLGLGNFDDQNRPQLLMSHRINENIKYLACGCSHSMILFKNGKLFVFGINTFGQLGLEHNKNKNTPQLLISEKENDKIVKIACGGFHSMFLKKNGELFVFGYNWYGQLGLNHMLDQNKPQLLMRDDTIAQITCGLNHSMILRKNGELLVFGKNYYGQLGLDYENFSSMDYRPGILEPKPQLLMKDKNIKQITCGYDYSMILKKNSELFVFGNNWYGQLGLNHDQNQIAPQLLLSNGILLPNTINTKEEWTPMDHKFYPKSFQDRIYIFLLMLKRKNLKIFIPKFISFEIIKKCI